MLINLSNHPTEKWSYEQTIASMNQFGHTEDLPFPAVSPAADTDEIIALAAEYVAKCLAMFAHYETDNPDDYPHAVHVQGEFTLTYHLVRLLKEVGVLCVASTSHRHTVDLGNGKKELQFNFMQFRAY